ncbi:hypothetical protein Tco_0621749 [Tanacetum coccineum]
MWRPRARAQHDMVRTCERGVSRGRDKQLNKYHRVIWIEEHNDTGVTIITLHCDGLGELVSHEYWVSESYVLWVIYRVVKFVTNGSLESLSGITRYSQRGVKLGALLCMQKWTLSEGHTFIYGYFPQCVTQLFEGVQQTLDTYCVRDLSYGQDTLSEAGVEMLVRRSGDILAYLLQSSAITPLSLTLVSICGIFDLDQGEEQSGRCVRSYDAHVTVSLNEGILFFWYVLFGVAEILISLEGGRGLVSSSYLLEITQLTRETRASSSTGESKYMGLLLKTWVSVSHGECVKWKEVVLGTYLGFMYWGSRTVQAQYDLGLDISWDAEDVQIVGYGLWRGHNVNSIEVYSTGMSDCDGHTVLRGYTYRIEEILVGVSFCGISDIELLVKFSYEELRLCLVVGEGGMWTSDLVFGGAGDTLRGFSHMFMRMRGCGRSTILGVSVDAHTSREVDTLCDDTESSVICQRQSLVRMVSLSGSYDGRKVIWRQCDSVGAIQEVPGRNRCYYRHDVVMMLVCDIDAEWFDESSKTGGCTMRGEMNDQVVDMVVDWRRVMRRQVVGVHFLCIMGGRGTGSYGIRTRGWWCSRQMDRHIGGAVTSSVLDGLMRQMGGSVHEMKELERSYETLAMRTEEYTQGDCDMRRKHGVWLELRRLSTVGILGWWYNVNIEVLFATFLALEYVDGFFGVGSDLHSVLYRWRLHARICYLYGVEYEMWSRGLSDLLLILSHMGCGYDSYL